MVYLVQVCRCSSESVVNHFPHIILLGTVVSFFLHGRHIQNFPSGMSLEVAVEVFHIDPVGASSLHAASSLYGES